MSFFHHANVRRTLGSRYIHILLCMYIHIQVLRHILLRLKVIFTDFYEINRYDCQEFEGKNTKWRVYKRKKGMSVKKELCLNLRIHKLLCKTDESTQGYWKGRHHI